MRNKLTKFLTSEYPPLGNKGIFAKTWKYAACMLLAFTLAIGQMWGEDVTWEGDNTVFVDKKLSDEVTTITVTKDASSSSKKISCINSTSNKQYLSINGGGKYLKFAAPLGYTITNIQMVWMSGAANQALPILFGESISAVGTVESKDKAVTITNGGFKMTNQIATSAGTNCDSPDDIALPSGTKQVMIGRSGAYSVANYTIGEVEETVKFRLAGVSGSYFTTAVGAESTPFIGRVTLTVVPEGYSITYHCNGATSGCPSDVASGATALPSTLATPVKTGFVFDKWYTDEGLTTPATAGATLTANANLYAGWIAAGSAYNVNIASMTNGSVVASPASQVEDGTVTLTVTPDDGYLLSSLSVIGDVSGDEVTVTANQFTMPAEDVTINATFSLAPTYTVTLNPAGGTIVDATGWTLNAGNYEKEVAEGTVLTLPTFTKTDRAFKTWRKVGPADVASPVTVDGDLSLTAIWTATIEQGIYSWESPDGTPNEVGGTAKFYNGDTDASSTAAPDNRVNYANKPVSGDDVTQYYTLRLDKAVDYSAEHVRISLNSALKEGDKIAITAYYTKEQAKTVAPKIANGSNEVVCSADNLANLYNGGTPVTQTKTLNDKAEGATTLKLTRSATSTTAFITKLQIIREVQVEEGDLLTVTLNYNDGATPNGSIMVASGQAVAQPANPTWAHHRFNGWKLGGSAYNFSSAVTANITLVADWTQLYTITYAKGDEGATGDAPVQEDKAQGETFTVAANSFALDGMDFSTWNDGTNDYAPGATYTVGTANVTLTAQWVTASTKYTVTYYNGATKLGEEIVSAGDSPVEAGDHETLNLATFVDWYSDADLAEEHKIADIAALTVDADKDVYGKWTYKYAVSTNIEQWVLTNGAGKTATTKTSALISQLGANNFASNLAWENGNIELDSLDDSKSARNNPYLGLKVKKGGKMLDFRLAAGKTVKVKFGNVGTTPNVAINGGEYAAMTISEGVYSYTAVSDAYISIKMADDKAVVFKQIMIGDAPEFETVVLPYRVTYDADGGTFAKDGKSDIYTGTPLVIGDATPADDEHLFDGWYDGETKINAASYVPTANVTLVAKYVMKPSPFSLTALTYTIGAGAAQNVGYVEGTYTYTVELPYKGGDYENITVAATLKEVSSSIVEGAVMTVTSLPGAATFTVSDGAEGTQLYTINFKKAAKDGVEIIGAVVTGNETATVSGLYKGTASVKLNNKKIDNGDYYIYVTLKEGYTFQDGDVLVVDVNTKSGIGTQALEICTGEGNLNNGILTSVAVEDYSTGENTIVLASVPAGATSIGLKRSDNLNAKINGLKVYRAMNPVLTAIQFNDTKVDVTGTTIAATLPNGTNLSTMTITPTIVWNGAGTAAAANTWEWGVANTYTVTDKDGDATVYTITLTEAIPAVDPTLTYNEGAYMVGASALDLSTLIDEADSDGEITYTVKTDGGTSATITDGKFTATAAGTATITATQAATVVYNAKTVDFDVVVAVATEKDGVKLVEADALTGNFRVAAAQFKSGGYTIDGITYANHFEMSSNVSSDAFAPDAAATKHINYTMTKKAAKFWLYTYNTYTSAYKVYAFVKEEGEDVATHSVSVENGAHLVSIDVSVNKNAEVFFATENKSKMVICQIVAVESGDALLQGGEQDYVIDLANGRLNASSATLRTIDGIEYMLSGDYKVAGTSYAKIATFGTHYVKFTLASPLEVNITTANTAAYYVGTTLDTEDDNSKLNETSPTKNVASNFSLAAGTYYISPKSSEVQISKLEFTAPKCAEPVIDAQPASKLDFAAGDMTASVTAHATDGGTLSYQWYKADDDSEVTGQTTATLTTTTEGTYYVIVTNTLADHSDNFVKSDEATLKYRKANDATLSSLTVSAGTLAPAFDPEVLEYNVTLSEGTVDVPTLTATAAMAAYGATADVTNATAFVNYEATSTVLVTAEDHSTQQTYTVHFYVEHTILALVDVTGDMTWDFSKDGLADQATVGTEVIMANVADVVNDANFKSDNIKVTANKQAGTKLQASMIMFHTTVDGLIKVVFSNTGDKSSERYLVVNGKKTDSGTKTKTNITYYGFVPAGDVVLTVIEGDGNMLNFASVQFTVKAAADLARDATTGDDWMAPGELGTICIPNGAVAVGGDLYTLEGKNSDGKIVFATVPNNKMTPGVPYLFQATSNSMKFYYTEEAAVTDPVNTGAMKGSFTNYTLTEGLENIYYFNGHALWSCASLDHLDVVANRAFVDMNAVSEFGSASPAPGRRYIYMGVHGQNAATDVDLLNAAEAPVKMIINGQLFILRGEKLYDATGRMVK